MGLNGLGAIEVMRGCSRSTVTVRLGETAPPQTVPLESHCTARTTWSPFGRPSVLRIAEYGALRSTTAFSPPTVNRTAPPGASAAASTDTPTVSPSTGAVSVGGAFATFTSTLATCGEQVEFTQPTAVSGCAPDTPNVSTNACASPPEVGTVQERPAVPSLNLTCGADDCACSVTVPDTVEPCPGLEMTGAG